MDNVPHILSMIVGTPFSREVNKTVNEDEVHTKINCDVADPSKYNFYWYFWSNPTKDHLKTNGFDQSWTFDPSHFPRVIPTEDRDKCDDRSEMFQPLTRPDTVVVCKLNFTLQQGWYQCVIRNKRTNAHEEKMVKLIIEGKRRQMVTGSATGSFRDMMFR